jgi:hypothetical protein
MRNTYYRQGLMWEYSKTQMTSESTPITMDSKIGLDYIVESKEYTTKLGSGQALCHRLNN